MRAKQITVGACMLQGIFLFLLTLSKSRVRVICRLIWGVRYRKELHSQACPFDYMVNLSILFAHTPQPLF